MHRSPLDLFRGEPRRQQEELCTAIAERWNDFDVCVVSAPVATGKLRLAEAIARAAAWKRNGLSSNGAALVLPTNVLVDQALAELRSFETLHRADRYQCTNGYPGSCVDRKAAVGRHCVPPAGGRYAAGACPYIRDLGAARSGTKLVTNQHIYMAHRLYRDVVIFDEAHTLVALAQGLRATALWRPQYRWPRTMRHVDDVGAWIDEVGVADERMELLRAVVHGEVGGYSIDLSEGSFRGREAECIRLVPLEGSGGVADDPVNALWPPRTKKIFLLSATIGRLDVEALGLADRRVLYLRVDSPIPPENRPFHWYPVADMRHRNRNWEIDRLASFLDEEVFPAHAGERGIVHLPYALVDQLYTRCTKSRHRLRTYTSERKRETLSSWLGEGGDAILLAPGLTEGIDLAGDLATFQVIAVTPRKSIGDPGLSWLAANYPDRYTWLTVRDIEQAYGRVCRFPEDRGTTLYTDSSGAPELLSDLVSPTLREAYSTETRALLAATLQRDGHASPKGAP